jgi:hypothetical protein
LWNETLAYSVFGHAFNAFAYYLKPRAYEANKELQTCAESALEGNFLARFVAPVGSGDVLLPSRHSPKRRLEEVSRGVGNADGRTLKLSLPT